LVKIAIRQGHDPHAGAACAKQRVRFEDLPEQSRPLASGFPGALDTGAKNLKLAFTFVKRISSLIFREQCADNDSRMDEITVFSRYPYDFCVSNLRLTVPEMVKIMPDMTFTYWGSCAICTKLAEGA